MQRLLRLSARPLLKQVVRGFDLNSEKSVASVLFERLPVVVPKIDPVVYAFQEVSFRWQQKYRRRYLNELLDKSNSRALFTSSPISLFFRCMSNVPENTVYGGPNVQNPNQRVTLTHLRQKHKKLEPITVVTAYDYPSAVHLDTAGIDVCLVGDSAAMVVHGYDTTLPISVDEMLVHCRAVARGAKRPLLVGDLPFGSYESSSTQAVDTAVRILKEGGMDAIKLEGGSPARINAAKAIVEAGIAVMGHVGLTPQAISVLGGFRPQGKNVASAVKVVETALALQEAGCFAVVLECVPPPVAAATTSALRIPTIGIGAGPFCSGQVLVYHDLLGMLQHPHHAKVTPKFCKQYARVGDVISKALLEYKEEVTSSSFPGPAHSPYKISSSDLNAFNKELQKLGLDKAASAAAEASEKIDKSKSLSKALLEYKEEVTSSSFPGPAHSPYKISSSDLNAFNKELPKLRLDKAASAAAEASEKFDFKSLREALSEWKEKMGSYDDLNAFNKDLQKLRLEKEASAAAEASEKIDKSKSLSGGTQH